MELVKVVTLFEQLNENEKWQQPFNQATFFNFDTNHPVTIGKVFVIPPAQAVTGGVVPGKFVVNLNVGEINTTYFTIDFVNGSTTNNLVIVYTEYQMQTAIKQ